MGQVSVWAPRANAVRLQVGDDSYVVPMDPGDDGWWSIDNGALVPGADYGFLLDDSGLLPDPRSRWQPDGVHGPSRIYPNDFAWSDSSWAGRDLVGAVIYELHVGTFTPGATLDSAIERLDYLADLGITHVELLPLNAFNGVWNWGYDGVDWYAVHAPYGGPDALKRFVDAAHARGLAVVLDVVYNHLGPSGNYLPQFGPYLKSGRNTWGDLVNLDGEDSAEVRRYILDNALMWLGEFHIDGLRLDAVHALVDDSPTHILKQLALEVADLEDQVGRPLSLIAESDLNDPKLIAPIDEGGFGLTGQWDDDVHHALHALLTGERRGYYSDFGSLECLAKVSTRAFFHDGTYSTFRGRDHGFPVDRERTSGWRFVTFLQDHDQVGNRAAGDRLDALMTPALLRVGAMLLLTSPYTPMLWMGEEWAASTPWPFFTSHPEPELAQAVSQGRLAEFSSHGWDPATMPDPQDPATYYSAVLRWAELSEPTHAPMLELYRQLITLRAATPDLSDPRLDTTDVQYDEAARWVVVHRGNYRVVANLADTTQAVTLAGAHEVVLSTADGSRLAGDTLTLPPQSAAIVQGR